MLVVLVLVLAVVLVLVVVFVLVLVGFEEVRSWNPHLNHHLRVYSYLTATMRMSNHEMFGSNAETRLELVGMILKVGDFLLVKNVMAPLKRSERPAGDELEQTWRRKRNVHQNSIVPGGLKSSDGCCYCCYCYCW